jgi:hypothetical protein
MGQFVAKDLTKNVQILMKRKSPQFMLSRIAAKPEFMAFLSGEQLIRAYTPDKEMFQAVLHMEETPQQRFWLEPRGMLPAKIDNGTILLLVFPMGNTNTIVQCIIKSLSLVIIDIIPVDPRRNERRRTLLPTIFCPADAAHLEEITSEKLIVRRSLEFQNPKIPTTVHACRDFLIETDVNGETAFDPEPRLTEKNRPINAIMADISSGGCCLMLPKATPLQPIENSMFGLVHFDIPTTAGKRTAHLFVLVRGMRHSASSHILHAMFLEPLPAEFLEI